ncbi:MAG: amidase, partial [Planctomycetota bacterium]
MACGEARAEMEEAETLQGRRATAKDFEPATWAIGLLGARITAAEFSKAVHVLKRTGRQMGPFFEAYDVLLTPTLAAPPLSTGALQPKGAEAWVMKLLGRLNAGRLIGALAGIEALADQVFEFIPFTPPFNATGQPA